MDEVVIIAALYTGANHFQNSYSICTLIDEKVKKNSFKQKKKQQRSGEIHPFVSLVI